MMYLLIKQIRKKSEIEINNKSKKMKIDNIA